MMKLAKGALALFFACIFSSWNVTAYANSLGNGVDASVSALVSDGEGISEDTETLSASASWPPPNDYAAVVSGSASATINPYGQLINITAALSQANNPYPYGLGEALASATLTYQLSVQPINAQAPVQSGVLVSIDGYSLFNLVNPMMSLSGSTSASASVSVYPTVGPIVGNAVPVYNGTFTQNGTYYQTFDLVPNDVYDVTMTASVAVIQQTGQETATIDPYFQIVDPNASQYELVFSSGIGNNPPSTPLPAAFPLFATGLSGLGLLGWRRKRKTVAAV